MSKDNKTNNRISKGEGGDNHTDFIKELLKVANKYEFNKLPSELRFNNQLFDLKSSEMKTRTPQLLYINKKSEGEIKRRTIATPFQPVQEFGDTKANWVNKLIWGDNAQALKHLIDTGDKVDLIYIDPPFATKSDFNKKGEVKAYRDKLAGADFVEFMRERLVLLKELLKDTGCIYVHLDNKMNSYIRVVMDEIFGKSNFVNEVIWNYKGTSNSKKMFARKHESIFLYSKSSHYIFNTDAIRIPFADLSQYKRDKDNKIYKKWNKEKNYYPPQKIVDGKWTLLGKICLDVFDDIPSMATAHGREYIGYPTQKPEKLLERIIKASSNEGDIVLDAFCGSGTTLAVAEKLNRKWIGIDAGKVAIHTTKKRILDLEKKHKPFVLCNSGVYEMQEVAMGGTQLKIDEEIYKQFACALFGIDTTKAMKEKGIEYDGMGRGNIRALVLSPVGCITKTILGKLAKHIGKGSVYLIYSQNQDRVIVNTLEVDGVKFYLHKIPHSLVGQFMLDCERPDDVSAITRNLRDIVVCKAGGVDNKAIEKIGKIAQPKSKKDIEQKFSNIAGFDFIDTTKFDIKTKQVSKDGKTTINLESIKTPQGEGIDKLAMILVDTSWNGKVFRLTETFWAENYIEEDEDGNENEIEGFVDKKCITFDTEKNKPFAVLYIDDYGNEFLEEKI